MTDHTDLLDTVDVHLKWLHRPNPKPDRHSVDNHQSAGYLERLAAALRAETERADALMVERDDTYLLQALWDVYGILGFDQDGDATPAAVKGDLADLVRDAAREARRDYDEALDAIPDSPVPCEYIVTVDEGTSYCSLAEGTPLFEGTVATTTDQFGHVRIGIVPDGPVPKRLLRRRVRVVAVDHQETTDG